MNDPSLGFYLWAYQQVKNVEVILQNMRQHYPDAELVVSSDNGYDFTEIAKQYNAIKYIHGTESHGSPDFTVDEHEGHSKCGWRLVQANLWLQRLYNACTVMESEYVMIMEEDVLITRPIDNPGKDINMTKFTNHIDPMAMEWIRARGGNDTYPFYGACGGSIIRREMFINAYNNHIQSYQEVYNTILNSNFLSGWGWPDCIICVLIYAAGGSISTDLDIGQHVGSYGEEYPNAIMHHFKRYYKV